MLFARLFMECLVTIVVITVGAQILGKIFLKDTADDEE